MMIDRYEKESVQIQCTLEERSSWSDAAQCAGAANETKEVGLYT